ncbi:hypothetical protein CBM2623_A170293 [Cupriavidus taiwanensis]|nr:hypothetical protein CBM2608_A160244 [Cupriavidus taiwanensis]SPA26162.1 hypothetical protein CBM2623_A170293 [Cupriavidus taiwanensis]
MQTFFHFCPGRKALERFSRGRERLRLQAQPGSRLRDRVLSWAPDHRKTRSAFEPRGFFVFDACFAHQIRQLALLAWRHCRDVITCERTGFFPSVKPRTVPRAAAAPQGYGNVGECNSFSGDSGIPAARANHFPTTTTPRRLTVPQCVTIMVSHCT